MTLPQSLHTTLDDFERLMTAISNSAAVRSSEAIGALIQLLWKSCREGNDTPLLRESITIISAIMDADYVTLLRLNEAHWTAEAESGTRGLLPISLLSEVLDREAASCEGSWIAAPLVPRDAAAGVLAGTSPSRQPPRSRLLTHWPRPWRPL